MPRGIDPTHQSIMTVLSEAAAPLTAADVHRLARFGTTPSIEGVGRRLKTLQARGWAERRDRGDRATWGATDLWRSGAAH
jgi:hypothetical protein